VAILTPEEAASVLDYTSPAEMPPKVTSLLLPAVDDFLKSATGKDWGAVTATYTAIDPTAKMAAGILLARWFENPTQVGATFDVGVLSLIAQLEAKVLQEKQAVVPV
jgi:hypothetical protein